MLDLYELKQFAAFADLGTLSKVAEEFHLSTPSITRSMQNLEESFGVKLFLRGKNRIELNETGKAAVGYARKLLQEADRAVEQVRAFDLRQKTIVVRSCAPAPLWELLKKLNHTDPGKMISSTICQNEELARQKELTFEEINGFNFLLRTELGFWDTMCREKMPASKFLVQTDTEAFNELVRASSLPCFITDYIQEKEMEDYGRIRIPITDPEAKVTFYVKELS